MQELLVVHSTRIEVELLRKGDANIWPATPTILKDGPLSLTSIGLTLPVAEIYAGTHLVG